MTSLKVRNNNRNTYESKAVRRTTKPKQFKLDFQHGGSIIQKRKWERGFQINSGISYSSYRTPKLEPSSKQMSTHMKRKLGWSHC